MAPIIGISAGTVRNPFDGTPFTALRPTYTHAVDLAGGVPLIIPHNVDATSLRRIYDQLDAVIVSGGGDLEPARYEAATSIYTAGIDESRDAAELELIRWAVDEQKPLLCICRGIQAMNVALGGTLIQDIRDEVPGALRHEHPGGRWFTHFAHDITVASDSKLYTAMGLETDTVAVNSLHHQALGRVADGLIITACAPDDIIEGVELPDHPFALGVQWHPEALVDDSPPMRHLFEALVQAAE